MKTFQTTLLYNLIVFNFILLEASTKKISNFFLEKFVSNVFLVKKNYFKLSAIELILSFKRFFRLLYFLKKKKSLLTFLGTENAIESLRELLAKTSLCCFVNLDFLKFQAGYGYSQSLMLFEHSLTKKQLFAFFLQKKILIQAFTIFENIYYFSIYKIFAALDDQKKLIFLSLILSSILKK